MRFSFLLLLFCLVFPAIAWSSISESSYAVSAQVDVEENSESVEQPDSGVMQAFTKNVVEKSDIVTIKDDTKYLVMFLMGVPLLILLITTVALGIAMGIYGKQVFLAHMICAALSMTLALAHAVVGIVWFYPF